jgi:peptide methionine sulfoxide reductase MsrA
VFVHNEAQAKAALTSLEDFQIRFKRPIVTEVTDASTFWPAEAYHQRYTERTGRGGCHVANW